jgi:hypothetical protein
MKRKIALEEHIESPLYFDDVENRLQEYKLRLDDMDATGIETTILSLTQPGDEGITVVDLRNESARLAVVPFGHGVIVSSKRLEAAAALAKARADLVKAQLGYQSQAELEVLIGRIPR